MRSTRKRREVLLSLVATRELRTQEDLARALKEEGFAVSQASVSRDIAALGLVKVDGKYALPSKEKTRKNPLEERIAGNLLGIRRSEPNLLILLTPPGEAPGVGLALDRLAPPGLAGTVAGDDTVFAAVEKPSDLARLEKLLKGLG
ncbi:MAG TPA: arginine repressor [Planctomycetes bacterium]|nr:arginine repressor [Planctomycetota bacterium]